jgi:hypothetical protein
MSPEQVKGKPVDGRSDIFSLGVMLYEMITGEKPFPGESITTVIYKIVNEDPLPPRQVNPSIHPGISAAVMRALAKDPETRYQSCRELLEDLRNYRNAAGAAANPQSTVVMAGGQASRAETIAVAMGGLRGLHNQDPVTMPVGRSLATSGANPSQTPVVRRLEPVAPHELPKKSGSVVGTVFAALILLGVIGYGGYKLRPVYKDVQQLRKMPADASNETSGVTSAAPEGATPTSTQQAPNPSDGAADSGNSTSVTAFPPPATIVPAVEAKSVEVVPEKPTPKKLEPALTAKAAQFKDQVEQAIEERGLSGRAKVQGVGNTLILAGKLRPAEHGALLKLLRDGPADVRVVDHIEYDDTSLAAGNNADQGHPVPAAGTGAIHVVTDVIGASALLHGPAGRELGKCLTPCSFNNLAPKQYSLDVSKDGYQPVRTALQVRAGAVSDQRLSLESLAKGLLISSQPAGADVFIDGAKQSGQTPVTLPLAPGQYNLVLRLQGYEAYSGTVQVKDNVQTQLAAKLTEKSNSRVAFAQVDTNPKGAEILVDGNSTGQSTPSRIELPVGVHTVTLKLDGFRPLKRTVQVSDGGTVTIVGSLKPN